MSYSTLADVRSIVDSDVEDAEVTNIITWIDATIDLMVPTGSLTVSFLEGLSARWAAYTIMLKDPSSRSLGEYSENRSEALKQLWAQIELLINAANGGIAVVPARSELP